MTKAKWGVEAMQLAWPDVYRVQWEVLKGPTRFTSLQMGQGDQYPGRVQSGACRARTAGRIGKRMR